MKVYIDREVYKQIMYWVNKAEGEVSGMGTIIKGPGYMRVVKACMLPQENGATTTELDAAGVAKAMYNLRNEAGELNWWWHSHVNFGVFWSGTDMDTIKEIGSNGYLLATVFNKKYELQTALWYNAPYKDEALNGSNGHVFLDKLETEIFDSHTEAQAAEWDAEYNRNIIERPRVASIYHRETWSNGYGSQGYLRLERGEDGRFLPPGQSRLSKKERKRLKRLERLGKNTATSGMTTAGDTSTSRASIVEDIATRIKDEIDYDEALEQARFNSDYAGPSDDRDTPHAEIFQRHARLLAATEQDLPMVYCGFAIDTFEELADIKQIALAGELA